MGKTLTLLIGGHPRDFRKSGGADFAGGTGAPPWTPLGAYREACGAAEPAARATKKPRRSGAVRMAEEATSSL
jgi:hypothetical protein